MEFVERQKCVISDVEDLELLYSFENFPVYMGCVEHPQEDDLVADMNWTISLGTGFVQLNPLIPLDILYPEQHAGAVGGLWKQHHKQFAEFISKYNCRSVLEIGGAHGLLAKVYKSIIDGVNWTMVEPNPALMTDVDINVIRGFFDSNFEIDNEVDVVIHSHVFEHVYEPKKFVEDISGFLDEGGMHIFSVPRMQVMLENGYTNCINFEHTTYLTEQYIDYILSEYGFSILEKKYYQDNHSIFYATRKTNNHCLKYCPKNYKGNKEVFEGFINDHLEIVNELEEKINKHNGPIYLFGGHIFAQYLIGFGLDESKIECILDNDTNKHDKRLYGTSLIVRATEVLADIDNAAVILRAGVYNNEIKQAIIENINDGVIFWE